MTLTPYASVRRSLFMIIFAALSWQHLQAQSYCRPALGSCCEWISNVTIGSINHNTVNESVYADYTNISTTVVKGTTYPISIKVSTNSFYVEHVTIYFDWDRDYAFESSVYLGTERFQGNKVFNGEVTVPSSATNGCSMMRVFMHYGTEPKGGCIEDGDGEVEDYTLIVGNISTPAANFTLPTPACIQSSLSFINTSTIPDESVLRHAWNFGDGTTSSSANGTKTYSQPGTYNVTLTTSTFCTSHSVTKSITVNLPPALTLQPAPVTACAGSNASFTVASSTAGVSYQWQLKRGSEFLTIYNGGLYANATTPTLTITGALQTMNGDQFRCAVTGICTTESSPATLTVPAPPAISLNPSNVSVCLSETASFSVDASGAGLTYQWQENSGGGFHNLSNSGAYSNVTSKSLSITDVKTSFHNYQFRCVVSGICSSFSTAATLSMQSPPAISTHPIDASIVAGTNIPFHIVASGTGLSYQWQENSGNGFINLYDNTEYTDVTSATMHIAGTRITKNGFRYRCVVSGACSPTATSATALLNVFNPVPTITSTPRLAVDEDSVYSYLITAFDSTGSKLGYSAPSKPAWLTFDTLAHVLSGTPTNDEVGIHHVTLSVTNGLERADQTFMIEIINTNDAPVITSSAITIITAGNLYSYHFTAVDMDAHDALSYAAPSIPGWLTFDAATGVLSGVPLPEQKGSYQVSLSVNDSSVSVDQNFSIEVMDGTTNANDLQPDDSVHVTDIRPIEITLSNNTFDSSSAFSSSIGKFTTIDEDDNHVYQLVSGEGSINNTAFRIEEDALYLDKNIVSAKQFSIRVRSTNSYGHSVEGIFTLHALDEELRGLTIPTTFSPDGDGINDKWVIKDLRDFTNVSIQIFDRSGVQLYHSMDPNQGWDGGMSEGKVLEGPFFYIVRIKDVIKKGVLIVIR